MNSSWIRLFLVASLYALLYFIFFVDFNDSGAFLMEDVAEILGRKGGGGKGGMVLLGIFAIPLFWALKPWAERAVREVDKQERARLKELDNRPIPILNQTEDILVGSENEADETKRHTENNEKGRDRIKWLLVLGVFLFPGVFILLGLTWYGVVQPAPTVTLIIMGLIFFVYKAIKG